MKHAFRHFAPNYVSRIFMAPESGDAGTGGGGGGGAIDRRQGDDAPIDSIEDALAELDRRAAERKAARKQAKKDDDPEDETDGEGDEPDARKAEKKAQKDPKDKPEKKGKPAADEAGDDESDGADEDGTAEASDDGAETPDDENAGENDEGDDQQPRALDDDTEVEIEHAGETQKVKLSELRKGYLRQSDFTQKTTQLAQERQVVQQAAGQLGAALQQLAQRQQHMAQFAQAMLGDEPSLDLAASDPGAFVAQRALFDQRQRALQAIQQQAHHTQQQQQALQQQQLGMQTMQQVQTLVQAVPELRDPKKREAFTRDVVEGASKYGFSAQDVGQVSDHRMLLLLRDLAVLQRGATRQQQATENVKKKLANVPPRPIKPGAATGNEGKSQRRAEARAKFMRSGRTIKDAMRVLDASD